MNYDNTGVCPITNCPDHYGSLPSCANLAVPYVPFQKNNPKKYGQTDALSNGTLFPGLNLPFHKKVEGSMVPETPLAELQAIEFVMLELGLYLDTHEDDMEAMEMFKQFAAMEREAKVNYEKQFGPLTQASAVVGDSYCWLKEPWPWNYQRNEVK